MTGALPCNHAPIYRRILLQKIIIRKTDKIIEIIQEELQIRWVVGDIEF